MREPAVAVLLRSCISVTCLTGLLTQLQMVLLCSRLLSLGGRRFCLLWEIIQLIALMSLHCKDSSAYVIMRRLSSSSVDSL